MLNLLQYVFHDRLFSTGPQGDIFLFTCLELFPSVTIVFDDLGHRREATVSFPAFFSRWRNLSCFPSEHASLGFVKKKYWMLLLECSKQPNVWLQQHWESLT